MTKYNADDVEKVMSVYNSNKNMAQTARITGISVSTIRSWIRKKVKVLTSERLKTQILLQYQEGKNCRELEAIYGIKQGTIRSWVHSHNIARHRGTMSRMLYEDYFSVIDTEQKAYYLGFIMADGNISSCNGYFLKIQIQYCDIEVLSGFLRQIGSKHSLYVKGNEKKYAYVSLGSKKMYLDLVKLGMQERNSGKQTVPDIPSHLLCHWFRGFFDGDGITDIKKKRSGFIATEDIINRIQYILSTNVQYVHPNNVNSQCLIYTMLYGRKDSRRLYNYLYSNATLWLSRKRQRMDIICDNTVVTD